MQQLEQMSLPERHELWKLRLSRRGLLRGVGLAAVGPLLHLPTAGASDSAETNIVGRWLAFGADSTTQMAVSWQVSGPVMRPQVRYGSDPSYGATAGAEATPLRTVLGTGASMTQHYLHAELSNLRPGTTYHYRVEHAGRVAADATFRTAPAAGSTEPFTFTAVGDQGVTADTVRLNRLVFQQQPVFHLVAGDLSYADSTGHGLPSDDLRPARWDRYFAQGDGVASGAPWMVAAGNHEMEAAYSHTGYGGLERRFRLPGNGPAGCPAVYSFRYANVGVVSLDANDTTDELTANRGYSGGRQTQWLISSLARLRDDPDIDFLVVFLHQCAYAVNAAHGSDGGVRTAWAPVFDRFEVDLVVSGHNHAYERSDPLRHGQVRRPAPSGASITPEVDGTTYIVVGGGGIGLTNFDVPDRYLGGAHAPRGAITSGLWTPDGRSVREEGSWSQARFSGYSLLAIDVRPGRSRSTMCVRALRENGALVDTVTLVRDRSRDMSRSIAVGVAGTATAAVGTALVVAQRRSQAERAGPHGDR